jgi:hypothetical protein
MRLEKELQDIYFPLITRLDAVRDFSIEMNKTTETDSSFAWWSIIIKSGDLLCSTWFFHKTDFIFVTT